MVWPANEFRRRGTRVASGGSLLPIFGGGRARRSPAPEHLAKWCKVERLQFSG